MTAPAGAVALEARGVRKRYRGGDGADLCVLDGVDLDVRTGEMVAIVGASGAGKSTLLHVLGALELPTSGEVKIAGESVLGRADADVAALRNRRVGFVFQFHHLLKEFSALENVAMPLRIAGVGDAEATRRAAALLAEVGLAQRASHRPAELSGGEQQRTAVARALAAEPSVLLADEPSGNLDHHTADQLHALLHDVVRRRGVAAVVVTHNRALAACADRVLLLSDGRLADTSVTEGAV